MNILYFLPVVIFALGFMIVLPKINKDRKRISDGTKLLSKSDVLLLSEISGVQTINGMPQDLVPNFNGSQLGTLISQDSEGNGVIYGVHEGLIKVVCKPSITRETPLTKEMALYYSNEEKEISFQGVKGCNYRLCLLDKKEIKKLNVASDLEIVFKGWVSKDTLHLCIVEDDNSKLYGDMFALFRQV